MKRILLLVIALTVAACGSTADVSELSGSETRNGGYGVVIEGKLVSLDLAMRNVHASPYVSTESDALLNSDETELLHYLLGDIASEPVRLIVIKKLAQLRQRLGSIGVALPTMFLIDNMTQLTWVRHAHLPCEDVRDDDNPYPNKVQLAYRFHATIRFCRDFDYLDQGNQAALIVHEIVYAALKEKSVLLDLVGYLFSDAYKGFSAPARLELTRLVDKLRPHLVGGKEYALVTSVGAIPPELTASWSLPAGFFPCFGKAVLDGQTVYAVWGMAQGGICISGERRAKERWLTLSVAADGSGRLDVGIVPVGKVDLAAVRLLALCSGDYTGMCALSFGAQDWALQTTAGGEDIHAAAAAGSIARVQHLLAQGVALEARNAAGETPFFVAVANKRPALAAWLLEKGADKNAANFAGLRPVSVAFGSKDSETVGLLAAAGVDVNTDKLLGRVVRYTGNRYVCDDVAMVKALLLSPTVDPHLTDARDGWLKDPWQIAVQANDRACVIAFLDRRDDIRLRLNSGPVVGLAVGLGNVALVDLLLSTPGVDPNMVGGSFNDELPIFAALRSGNLQIVTRLLDHSDVDVNRTSPGGSTLLGVAVAQRSRDAVDLLLDRGAAIDVRTARNPLNPHIACVTPLMTAASRGFDELVALLVDEGASLEATDCDRNYGDSYRVLAFAAETGNLSTVKLLVARGALVNVPDAPRPSSQPLCVARQNSRAAVAEYLVSVGATCS